MKKRIYRILSIVLCLQLVFGLIPIGFDHDHEGLMLTAHAWDVESTCEFCGSFIADDYICDCGEGGDHRLRRRRRPLLGRKRTRLLRREPLR